MLVPDRCDLLFRWPVGHEWGHLPVVRVVAPLGEVEHEREDGLTVLQHVRPLQALVKAVEGKGVGVATLANLKTG